MKDDICKTSDLYIAAFLLSQGAILMDIDKTDKKRMVFTLRMDKEKTDDLISGYWSGAPMMTVPAQLFSALKHLKGLLHNVTTNS